MEEIELILRYLIVTWHPLGELTSFPHRDPYQLFLLFTCSHLLLGFPRQSSILDALVGFISGSRQANRTDKSAST